MAQLEAEARNLMGVIAETFTAAAAYIVGEILKLGSGHAAVVISNNLNSGDEAAAYISGLFDIKCAAATTFVAGDPVYWDASAGLAVTTPANSDDHYLGTAFAASDSSTAYVQTRLNQEVRAGLSPSLIASCAPVIDHADTEAVEILSASQNANGMLVLSYHGVVTEQPAGSSEDQLIVSLLDEDDNAISTLTTTDTTPDAVGDYIKGALSVVGAATGTVAAIIPAGKGAKVKVTQATAGTPAGALRVQALFVPLF